MSFFSDREGNSQSSKNLNPFKIRNIHSIFEMQEGFDLNIRIYTLESGIGVPPKYLLILTKKNPKNNKRSHTFILEYLWNPVSFYNEC